MALSLTVLGSGTSVPTPGRRPAAYLSRTGDTTLLMDCGAGAVGSMVNMGTTIQEIEGVALSHLHPDHTGDLVTLLFALTNPVCPPRSSPLNIWGPPGTRAMIHALAGVYGRWIQPETCEVRVMELIAGEPVSIGGATLTPEAVLHSGECCCFRLEHGDQTLCYSGDSGPCAGLQGAAKAADLLVCECSVLEDEEVSGHMRASQVGDLAREAGCGQVVLTHLYPHILEADPMKIIKERFAGPVELAFDGMQIKVPKR